jgi:hypothetical protein
MTICDHMDARLKTFLGDDSVQVTATRYTTESILADLGYPNPYWPLHADKLA